MDKPMDRSKEQPHVVMPPSTAMAGALLSSHGVDTQSPIYALAEYGSAGGLVHPQPKPGLQFTLLLEPGWGARYM